MTDRVRTRAIVSGLVQGVGFRYSAAREAIRLGVAGWVRNLPDGRVEALAEGDRQAVDAFVAWLRRGPRGADVERVEVSQEPYRGDLDAFDIAH
jgi:acylphosphatase